MTPAERLGRCAAALRALPSILWKFEAGLKGIECHPDVKFVGRRIVGERVGLSAAILMAGNRIEIGEGSILGVGAMVPDNDFHAPAGDWGWRNGYVGNSKPIVIGRGVFVGARAIILKGVTIGDSAVVGAGAVVTSDVPAGCVAAGNPARIVRSVGGSDRESE